MIENLTFYAGIYGVPRAKRRARVEAVLERSGLSGRRTQLAGTLSGGWKQRVALASATIHEPPLLFLDEPTAGVDPVSRREFWEQIHALAADGTTVLLTTHYMDEAERCHRLAFIFRGQLLDVGTPEKIIERRALRALELTTDQPREAALLLRQQPEVDEVAHYGHVLRLTTRNGTEPSTFARQLLERHGIAVQASSPSRVSVEDAFVSMVREGRSHPRPRRVIPISAFSSLPLTPNPSLLTPMFGRPLVIAWKELLQLRRDRMTLAMMVVLPIVQLLLFGYAINTDVPPHPDRDLRSRSQRGFARAGAKPARYGILRPFG